MLKILCQQLVAHACICTLINIIKQSLFVLRIPNTTEVAQNAVNSIDKQRLLDTINGDRPGKLNTFLKNFKKQVTTKEKLYQCSPRGNEYLTLLFVNICQWDNITVSPIFEQTDFLSVHIEYNCASTSNFAKELSALQVRKQFKVLFFKFAILLQPHNSYFVDVECGPAHPDIRRDCSQLS